nr:hypothetical protein [Tanacetum cinerariifolium]
MKQKRSGRSVLAQGSPTENTHHYKCYTLIKAEPAHTKRAKATTTDHSSMPVSVTADRTSIPISRIFGRFRILSAKNFQTNYMIRTDMLQNVIAQPRFTTDVNTSVVACLPVHTSKGLTTHLEEDVKCQRRVSKMCSVDNGSASLSANLSSLPTSAQQHLHTTDIYRNRRMTDANDTITLRTMETSTKTNKPALRSEARFENLVYYCYVTGFIDH